MCKSMKASLEREDIIVDGGMEEESRKSFLVAVEKRDEATLLPIIQKAYCNLEKHGYVHRTVNHSKEFVTKTIHENHSRFVLENNERSCEH